jgi:hypothetical protein
MLSQDTSKWTICNKPECRHRNVVSTLRTRFSASRWLFQYKSDAGKLREMRSLISKPGVPPAANMSDQDLLDKLADLLATGNLHVHAPEEEESGGGGGSQSSIVEMAPPFPLSERKPQAARTSSPEPLIDPPTLPDNSDFSAQAATLVAAADDGSAFCEVCQKQG